MPGRREDAIAVFPPGGESDSETKYFGDENTDGSWRITVSGTNLLVERRESGVWVEKSAFLAS